MIDLSNARLLARYRLWADQLTFETVAMLPPGEAERKHSTPLESIIGTLNHNYVVDLIWRGHLESRDHGFTAPHVILHEDLSELWEAQQANHRWFIAWSDRQTAQSLGQSVRFRFIDGSRGAMTRGEILLHVVNHATYHRGWIAQMLFQIPAPNPTTDLPVYLRHLRGERAMSRLDASRPSPSPRADGTSTPALAGTVQAGG